LELIVNLWYNTYMVDTSKYQKRPEQPSPLEVGGDGNRDFKNNPKVEILTGEELAAADRTKVAGDILKKVDQIEAGEAQVVDPSILKGAETETQNPHVHVENLQSFLDALNGGSFNPAEFTDQVLNSGSDKAGLN
jgi:hypothetical protein